MPDFDPATGNIIDFRTAAQLNASTQTEEDPEKAATALDREKHYGIPAQAYMSDPEGFDEMLKRSLGGRIIAKNTHLQDFLNSHPVHGALIHDDLGALDKVSEEHAKLTAPLQSLRDFGEAVSHIPSDIGASVNENAAALYELRRRAEAKEGGFAPDASALARAGELYNIGSAALGLLWSPLTGTSTSLIGRPRAQQETELLRQRIGTPYPGYELPPQQEAEEAEAKSIGEAAAQLIPFLPNIKLPSLRGKRLSTPEEIEAFLNSDAGHKARAEIDEFLRQQGSGVTTESAINTAQDAMPFIKQGKPPPPGVAPEFDKYHQEVAKADAKALEEMLKAVQETSLRERSPDALEQFIASHGDRTIGIQADAVRELYGSTVPSPDDSKLGFIPGLARQLATAEAYGGDVEVPLSTWLAKVPPETAKLLKDFVRVREGGMTPFEAKEEPIEYKEPAPITLQQTGIIAHPQGNIHEFEITKDNEPAGFVRLQPSGDGKDLKVNYISSGGRLEEPSAANFNILGPSAIRGIARQIRAQFPDAETISGLRVSEDQRRPVSVSISKAAGEQEAANTNLPPREQFIDDYDRLIREQAARLNREDFAVVPGGKPPEAEPLKLEVLQRGRSGRPIRTASLGATEDKVMRTARTYQRVAATRALAEETGFNVTALSRAMTTDMMRRYSDLIRKEIETDVAKQEKRQLDIARREQTKTWRDNKAALEPDVAKEVRNRPEVLAAQVLRSKGAEAADKDALARSFGYSTGDEMMQAFRAFENMRGDKPHGEYVKQLIKEEVNRQMQAKYGDLSENIIREAKEHVLRPTVMQRIAEEVQAFGMQAGGQVPISKDALRAWVDQAMRNMPWTAINSDKFLAKAGKAGRKAEEALLKGKNLEAFQFKQQQQLSLELARQALDFEVAQRTFVRNMASYAKREGPPNRDTRYTHQIQGILQRMGVAVERSPADLADQIDRDKTGTLPVFVANEQAKLIPLDVADFLLDPSFPKKLKDLSAEEYMGLATTVKIMDKLGRDAEVLMAQDERAKLGVVIARMEPLAARFAEIPFTYKREGWTSKIADFPAQLIQVETLLRHWDNDDRYGPFQRYIIQRLTNGVNQHSAWEREYGPLLRAVGKIKDPGKLVNNPWFIDPRNGRPIQLDREGLLEIISHWGNESNRDKLLKGWKIISKEGKMEDWVVRQEFDRWLVENSTPADWKRQEAIGKVFTKAFNEISKPLYHRLTGDTPEALDLEPFVNAHGKFEGWYHPINYDTELNPIRGAVANAGLTSPDFSASFPANRYTKSRTGYYGYIDLSSGLVPYRLNQMLRDGALREAVIDVNKLFKEQAFRNMVNTRYGGKYMKDLDDWLQHVVNGSNINQGQFKGVQQVMGYLRENYVSSQINYNIGTALKHGPTALAFSLRRTGLSVASEYLRYFYDHREYMRVDAFARQSLELQRRARTFDEVNGSLNGALEQGNLSTILQARNLWNHFGTWMVAKSDWISTKAQWMTRYKQAFIETQGDHEQAMLQADAEVRQTHGSTAPTSLPAAQRDANEATKWAFSLFTFWGTRFQRQAETVWKVKDAWNLGRDGEIKEALKKLASASFDAAVYTVFPVIWDLAVASGKPRNWLTAVIAGSLVSSIPYVRDLYHAVETGQEPEGGLISSFAKDAYRAASRFAGRTKASAEQYLDSFLFALGELGFGAHGAKSTVKRVTGAGKK